MTDFVGTVGPAPDLFWRSTPRELLSYSRGARKRFVREHNTAVTAAYIGGIVAKADKTPPLENYLITENAKPQAPPSWQRLLQTAKAWDAAINQRR